MPKKFRSGFTSLLVVIVMAIVLVTLTVGLNFSSINTNQISLYQSSGNKTFQDLDGCAEEALARLNRNNVYSGGSYSINNATCNVTVAGTDPARTLTITLANSDYSKSLQATVTIFPDFTLNSWQELTN